jgi:hypothetical protein
MPNRARGTTNSRLVLLEMNEVNFEFLRKYVALGELPTFAQLIDKHGIQYTTSEREYEYLEPWIQWVSAHTGLTYDEHRVMRLGDIVAHDYEQIWEALEDRGIKVGAVSPINAKNKTRNAAFFVPDPWTRTTVSGSSELHGLHAALAQAVSDNAQNRLSVRSACLMFWALLRNCRPQSLRALLALALQSRAYPWRRAMFLDRFLADVFLSQWRRTNPGFGSLFLNAAAHIQHHYLFSSAAYSGANRNPTWYLRRGIDPVRDVYRLYDRVLLDVLSLPDAPRVIVATGLHQEPHSSATYYYRLRNHEAFLRRIGIRFRTVEPRMSRDFTVYCGTREDAQIAATQLDKLVSPAGEKLFTVDNRGTDLFVMLTYPHEISRGFFFCGSEGPLWDLSADVVFVALKNGEHHGTGYVIDTALSASTAVTTLPLTQIFDRTLEAFGFSKRVSGAPDGASIPMLGPLGIR